MGREVEIRTARLVLRSFREADVDDALAYRDVPSALIRELIDHSYELVTRGRRRRSQ